MNKRIFNVSKTQELISPNLELGTLIDDKILIAHHTAVAEVQEQSHVVVVAEYPNGGKDVETVIDTPYSPQKDAYDEYEDILIYMPYSAEKLQEIANNKILAKNKARMTQLSQDFIQATIGEIIPNLADKKAEFIRLHNEVMVLEGKEPRETIGEL